MKRNSETLFHLTKTIDVLGSILRNGFWPQYCLEDVLQWTGDYDIETMQVAMPIVCFCDIPLSKIGEHVSFYGEFGIGMTLDWAVRSALSPVHYVDMDGVVVKALRKIPDIAVYDLEEGEGSELLRQLFQLAIHMKPLSGSVLVQGKPVQKDFYAESEWRHVAHGPSFQPHLQGKAFSNLPNLCLQNIKTRESAMLEFSPSDIKYIFVKRDSDIPEMIDFNQQNLDKHPASELKVLISRVTSLERIRSSW